MSVFKSFSLMSILTFLSRILGYVRDLLFAFIFGASSSADSFLLAFRLPNLFRRLFAEGAIGNALIPLYLDIKKKSNKKIAQSFYNSVFNYLIIIAIGKFKLSLIKNAYFLFVLPLTIALSPVPKFHNDSLLRVYGDIFEMP